MYVEHNRPNFIRHSTPVITVTRCVGSRHTNRSPPPLQVNNIFAFIRQVAGLFRHVGYLGHLHFCNKLTFDLLTLKVVSKSRVTWATSVPILVFLGLSVLDLGPMNATDRRRRTSDVRQASVADHRLMPPHRGGIIISPRLHERNATTGARTVDTMTRKSALIGMTKCHRPLKTRRHLVCRIHLSRRRQV